MIRVPDRKIDPPEMPPPVCPVCGNECEKIYIDGNNDVVGCDECLRSVYACDIEVDGS